MSCNTDDVVTVSGGFKHAVDEHQVKQIQRALSTLPGSSAPNVTKTRFTAAVPHSLGPEVVLTAIESTGMSRDSVWITT